MKMEYEDEKLKNALRQYANHVNWIRTDYQSYDKFVPYLDKNVDGWEIAEKALGENNG